MKIKLIPIIVTIICISSCRVFLGPTIITANTTVDEMALPKNTHHFCASFIESWDIYYNFEYKVLVFEGVAPFYKFVDKTLYYYWNDKINEYHIEWQKKSVTCCFLRSYLEHTKNTNGSMEDKIHYRLDCVAIQETDNNSAHIQCLFNHAIPIDKKVEYLNNWKRYANEYHAIRYTELR